MRGFAVVEVPAFGLGKIEGLLCFKCGGKLIEYGGCPDARARCSDCGERYGAYDVAFMDLFEPPLTHCDRAAAPAAFQGVRFQNWSGQA